MTASPVQISSLRGVSTRKAVILILIVSALALALLVTVIYGHGRASHVPAWVSYLPALNAVLNGTSAALLLSAYRVRFTDSAAHGRRMLSALGSSSLFLVSYLVYHSLHADTLFTGQGVVRPIYFFILISHIVLSALVLPLIFSSFFFALSGRIPLHKKVSKVTFPIWLYVSVTGVLVFLFLRAYA